MNTNEIVVERDTFSILSRECAGIIDMQKRLPDFVFKRSFAKYFVIGYHYIYKKEFGSFLFKAASYFGDELVNYITIEPHPVDGYYPRNSFFGLASFKPADLTDRYVSTMYCVRNGPMFLAGVDIGAFWGSSLKWGIFCDRISWELIVIAAPGDFDAQAIGGFDCMDAAGLSNYMKGQYHWKPSVAIEFNKKFLPNYNMA